MEITKNRYLTGFAAIVFLLAIVRLIFPSVAHHTAHNENGEIADSLVADSLEKTEEEQKAIAMMEAKKAEEEKRAEEVRKAEEERKADSIKKAEEAQKTALTETPKTETFGSLPPDAQSHFGAQQQPASRPANMMDVMSLTVFIAFPFLFSFP